MYPEYYRKPVENTKGSNNETPDPFCIGLIQEIRYISVEKVKITVRKFYRPENTKTGIFLSYKQDLNLLYWSEEGNLIKYTACRMNKY